MDLYPAVDIRAGAAVRLFQGRFDRPESYGDPVELARSYVERGARRLHVVDLDAARSGSPVNRQVVTEIVQAAGVPVQFGGGIRAQNDVAGILDVGVERVVMGTAAVSDPELLAVVARAHPGHVCVGIDYRAGTDSLGISGWEETAQVSLGELLGRCSALPLAGIVVTAIDRDGTMEGPDLAGLERIVGLTDHPVTAAGGIASVDDLVAVGDIEVDGRRVAGVITGKAVASGALSLEDAMKVCS